MRFTKHIFLLAAATLPAVAMAQGAVDAANLSQTDLRGSARFMSMGGAFTALGGDITSLNQNPAGIGIYRSSEVGLTLNLDFQKTTTSAQGNSIDETKTKFNFNNFGYVGSMLIPDSELKSISWGVGYSRIASFDRVARGNLGNLNGASLTNYIAGMTNAAGTELEDLQFGSNFNPYVNGDAAWLDILGYNSYLINDCGLTPTNSTNFQGLMGNGTTGTAGFLLREKGQVDEYTFSLGGNVSNVVYWGLGLGVTDISYTQLSYYDENLTNSYSVSKLRGSGEYEIENGTGSAAYTLGNYLHSSGSGVNVKLGLIFRPINELRLGVAFHTPTWYNMTDTYSGNVSYRYLPSSDRIYEPEISGTEYTNDGRESGNDYHLRTPWRLMVGAAGVIGTQGIISIDYEYRASDAMRISDPDGYEYEDVTSDIKTYYKGTNIVRIGGELRVTPQFSLRVGYSYESSPVKQQAANDREFIWTAGTIPSYSFNKTTQYVTAGLGYRYKGFYADLAYVNKQRETTWHAFTPMIENGNTLQGSPSAGIKSNNNQVVLTVGYKF